MVRQRVTLIDVVAIVCELKDKLIGLRLNNVYDVNPKTFLFKFDRPEGKEFLLVESGNRFHLTKYERDKSTIPNNFVVKLRKHIRKKRLDDVKQLGVDRVVDLTFGSGEAACHIILEFHSGGNVILTDHAYTILTILRPYGEGESKMISGKTYTGVHAKPFTRMTRESTQNLLYQSEKSVLETLRSLGVYGQAVIEHGIRAANLSQSTLDKNASLVTEEEVDAITHVLETADNVLIHRATTPGNGYILLNKNYAPQEGDEVHLNGMVIVDKDRRRDMRKAFDEAVPQLLAVHQERNYLLFSSFNETLDEFFFEQEAKVAEKIVEIKRKEINKKVEKIKVDQEKRLQGLAAAEQHSRKCAELIELNADLVDECLRVINGSLATGMDWDALWAVVKEQQKLNNPIACAIKRLKLAQGTITLLLDMPFQESDESGTNDGSDSDIQQERERGRKKSTKKTKTEVDIDISMNAFSNARRYYEAKKKNAAKMERTVIGSEKAIKAAEKTSKKAISKEENVPKKLSIKRKPLWFEKFHWFISSENYLVIAGRDTQQNEILVKKYLKQGDAYVHADLHGARSCIVKNPTGDPITPLTLSQAGLFTVCFSAAWDNKVVTSAYWVESHQVSKTAPTGEYLTAGSFMIRGKKNYLPPQPLVMGFGILFRVDDSSVEQHIGERRPKSSAEDWSNKYGLGADPDTKNPTESAVEEEEQEASAKDSEENPRISMAFSAIDAKDIALDEDEATGGNKDEDVLEKKDYRQEKEQQKQRMSAARRRRLEKQAKKEVNMETVRAEPDTKAVEDLPSTNKGKKQQPPKRGKKGQAKRKQKYEYQSDEERDLMMRLLHSGTLEATERVESHQQSSQNTEEAAPRPADPFEAVKEEQPQEVYAMESDEEDDATVSRDAIIERVPDDDESDEFDDEDSGLSKIGELDHFTGMPREDDSILYALPMCAPYGCLQSFKYKVKLLPGGLKKGKAAKAALWMFYELKEATLPELTLIRSISDNEFIQSIIGNARVVQSGGAAASGPKQGKGRGRRKAKK